MFLKSKRLYRTILGSFVLLIFLTVILTTVIEFLLTKSELPGLLTDVRTMSTAQILSSSYSREGNWGRLNEDILNLGLAGEREAAEGYHLRIIVRDSQGKTLYNSFTNILERVDSPLIEGRSRGILDYNNGEKVGTVTLYINRRYLEKETGRYILGILKPRILQGLVAVAVALIIASLLSKGITAPIERLTSAAQSIERKGVIRYLPVESADELGRLSRTFNQMISSLEKQREMRRRLIRDVSHDINTPLNVIRLEAKGLSDNLVTPARASSNIIDEVDNLLNLIHDLDWLAETDSGQFRLNKRDCNLGDIIRSETERWRLKAEAEGITLVLETLPDRLPPVEIDAARFGQVLGNLIENALKYTPSPGTVTLSCRMAGEEILITVEDTGQGIPPDDLPHIFERFFRTDRSRSGGRTGRGLGLSIVKQIVELHGGRITAESRPEQGSRFSIALPL